MSDREENMSEVCEKFAAKDMHLAFENSFIDQQPKLWRVMVWRNHGERRLRHTNWFASQEDFTAFLSRSKERGDQIISTAQYEQAGPTSEAGGALRLLKRLAEQRGFIVSSADCSATEIADAMSKGNWYVDDAGYGYVLRQ